MYDVLEEIYTPEKVFVIFFLCLIHREYKPHSIAPVWTIHFIAACDLWLIGSIDNQFHLLSQRNLSIVISFNSFQLETLSEKEILRRKQSEHRDHSPNRKKPKDTLNKGPGHIGQMNLELETQLQVLSDIPGASEPSDVVINQNLARIAVASKGNTVVIWVLDRRPAQMPPSEPESQLGIPLTYDLPIEGVTLLSQNSKALVPARSPLLDNTNGEDSSVGDLSSKINQIKALLQGDDGFLRLRMVSKIHLPRTIGYIKQLSSLDFHEVLLGNVTQSQTIFAWCWRTGYCLTEITVPHVVTSLRCDRGAHLLVSTEGDSLITYRFWRNQDARVVGFMPHVTLERERAHEELLIASRIRAGDEADSMKDVRKRAVQLMLRQQDSSSASPSLANSAICTGASPGGRKRQNSPVSRSPSRKGANESNGGGSDASKAFGMVADSYAIKEMLKVAEVLKISGAHTDNHSRGLPIAPPSKKRAEELMMKDEESEEAVEDESEATESNRPKSIMDLKRLGNNNQSALQVSTSKAKLNGNNVSFSADPNEHKEELTNNNNNGINKANPKSSGKKNTVVGRGSIGPFASMLSLLIEDCKVGGYCFALTGGGQLLHVNVRGGVMLDLVDLQQYYRGNLKKRMVSAVKHRMQSSFDRFAILPPSIIESATDGTAPHASPSRLLVSFMDVVYIFKLFASTDLALPLNSYLPVSCPIQTIIPHPTRLIHVASPSPCATETQAATLYNRIIVPEPCSTFIPIDPLKEPPAPPLKAAKWEMATVTEARLASDFIFLHAGDQGGLITLLAHAPRSIDHYPHSSSKFSSLTLLKQKQKKANKQNNQHDVINISEDDTDQRINNFNMKHNTLSDDDSKYTISQTTENNLKFVTQSPILSVWDHITPLQVGNKVRSVISQHVSSLFSVFTKAVELDSSLSLAPLSVIDEIVGFGAPAAANSSSFVSPISSAFSNSPNNSILVQAYTGGLIEAFIPYATNSQLNAALASEKLSLAHLLTIACKDLPSRLVPNIKMSDIDAFHSSLQQVRVSLSSKRRGGLLLTHQFKSPENVTALTVLPTPANLLETLVSVSPQQCRVSIPDEGLLLSDPFKVQRRLATFAPSCQPDRQETAPWPLSPSQVSNGTLMVSGDDRGSIHLWLLANFQQSIDRSPPPEGANSSTARLLSKQRELVSRRATRRLGSIPWKEAGSIVNIVPIIKEAENVFAASEASARLLSFIQGRKGRHIGTDEKMVANFNLIAFGSSGRIRCIKICLERRAEGFFGLTLSCLWTIDLAVPSELESGKFSSPKPTVSKVITSLAIPFICVGTECGRVKILRGTAGFGGKAANHTIGLAVETGVLEEDSNLILGLSSHQHRDKGESVKPGTKLKNIRNNASGILSPSERLELCHSQWDHLNCKFASTDIHETPIVSIEASSVTPHIYTACRRCIFQWSLTQTAFSAAAPDSTGLSPVHPTPLRVIHFLPTLNHLVLLDSEFPGVHGGPLFLSMFDKQNSIRSFTFDLARPVKISSLQPSHPSLKESPSKPHNSLSAKPAPTLQELLDRGQSDAYLSVYNSMRNADPSNLDIFKRFVPNYKSPKELSKLLRMNMSQSAPKLAPLAAELDHTKINSSTGGEFSILSPRSLVSDSASIVSASRKKKSKQALQFTFGSLVGRSLPGQANIRHLTMQGFMEMNAKGPMGELQHILQQGKEDMVIRQQQEMKEREKEMKEQEMQIEQEFGGSSHISSQLGHQSSMQTSRKQLPSNSNRQAFSQSQNKNIPKQIRISADEMANFDRDKPIPGSQQEATAINAREAMALARMQALEGDGYLQAVKGLAKKDIATKLHLEGVRHQRRQETRRRLHLLDLRNIIWTAKLKGLLPLSLPVPVCAGTELEHLASYAMDLIRGVEDSERLAQVKRDHIKLSFSFHRSTVKKQLTSSPAKTHIIASDPEESRAGNLFSPARVNRKQKSPIFDLSAALHVQGSNSLTSDNHSFDALETEESISSSSLNPQNLTGDIIEHSSQERENPHLALNKKKRAKAQILNFPSRGKTSNHSRPASAQPALFKAASNSLLERTEEIFDYSAVNADIPDGHLNYFLAGPHPPAHLNGNRADNLKRMLNEVATRKTRHYSPPQKKFPLSPSAFHNEQVKEQSDTIVSASLSNVFAISPSRVGTAKTRTFQGASLRVRTPVSPNTAPSLNPHVSFPSATLETSLQTLRTQMNPSSPPGPTRHATASQVQVDHISSLHPHASTRPQTKEMSRPSSPSFNEFLAVHSPYHQESFSSSSSSLSLLRMRYSPSNHSPKSIHSPAVRSRHRVSPPHVSSVDPRPLLVVRDNEYDRPLTPDTIVLKDRRSPSGLSTLRKTAIDLKAEPPSLIATIDNPSPIPRVAILRTILKSTPSDKLLSLLPQSRGNQNPSTNHLDLSSTAQSEEKAAAAEEGDLEYSVKFVRKVEVHKLKEQRIKSYRQHQKEEEEKRKRASKNSKFRFSSSFPHVQSVLKKAATDAAFELWPGTRHVRESLFIQQEEELIAQTARNILIQERSQSANPLSSPPRPVNLTTPHTNSTKIRPESSSSSRRTSNRASPTSRVDVVSSRRNISSPSHNKSPSTPKIYFPCLPPSREPGPLRVVPDLPPLKPLSIDSATISPPRNVIMSLLTLSDPEGEPSFTAFPLESVYFPLSSRVASSVPLQGVVYRAQQHTKQLAANPHCDMLPVCRASHVAYSRIMQQAGTASEPASPKDIEPHWHDLLDRAVEKIKFARDGQEVNNSIYSQPSSNLNSKAALADNESLSLIEILENHQHLRNTNNLLKNHSPRHLMHDVEKRLLSLLRVQGIHLSNLPPVSHAPPVSTRLYPDLPPGHLSPPRPPPVSSRLVSPTSFFVKNSPNTRGILRKGRAFPSLTIHGSSLLANLHPSQHSKYPHKPSPSRDPFFEGLPLDPEFPAGGVIGPQIRSIVPPLAILRKLPLTAMPVTQFQSMMDVHLEEMARKRAEQLERKLKEHRLAKMAALGGAEGQSSINDVSMDIDEVYAQQLRDNGDNDPVDSVLNFLSYAMSDRMLAFERQEAIKKILGALTDAVLAGAEQKIAMSQASSAFHSLRFVGDEIEMLDYVAQEVIRAAASERMKKTKELLGKRSNILKLVQRQFIKDKPPEMDFSQEMHGAHYGAHYEPGTEDDPRFAMLMMRRNQAKFDGEDMTLAEKLTMYNRTANIANTALNISSNRNNNYNSPGTSNLHQSRANSRAVTPRTGRSRKELDNSTHYPAIKNLVSSPALSQNVISTRRKVVTTVDSPSRAAQQPSAGLNDKELTARSKITQNASKATPRSVRGAQQPDPPQSPPSPNGLNDEKRLGDGTSLMRSSPTFTSNDADSKSKLSRVDVNSINFDEATNRGKKKKAEKPGNNLGEKTVKSSLFDFSSATANIPTSDETHRRLSPDGIASRVRNRDLNSGGALLDEGDGGHGASLLEELSAQALQEKLMHEANRRRLMEEENRRLRQEKAALEREKVEMERADLESRESEVSRKKEEEFLRQEAHLRRLKEIADREQMETARMMAAEDDSIRYNKFWKAERRRIERMKMAAEQEAKERLERKKLLDKTDRELKERVRRGLLLDSEPGYLTIGELAEVVGIVGGEHADALADNGLLTGGVGINGEGYKITADSLMRFSTGLNGAVLAALCGFDLQDLSPNQFFFPNQTIAPVTKEAAGRVVHLLKELSREIARRKAKNSNAVRSVQDAQRTQLALLNRKADGLEDEVEALKVISYQKAKKGVTKSRKATAVAKLKRKLKKLENGGASMASSSGFASDSNFDDTIVGSGLQDSESSEDDTKVMEDSRMLHQMSDEAFHGKILVWGGVEDVTNNLRDGGDGFDLASSDGNSMVRSQGNAQGHYNEDEDDVKNPTEIWTERFKTVRDIIKTGRIHLTEPDVNWICDELSDLARNTPYALASSRGLAPAWRELAVEALHMLGRVPSNSFPLQKQSSDELDNIIKDYRSIPNINAADDLQHGLAFLDDATEETIMWMKLKKDMLDENSAMMVDAHLTSPFYNRLLNTAGRRPFEVENSLLGSNLNNSSNSSNNETEVFDAFNNNSSISNHRSKSKFSDGSLKNNQFLKVVPNQKDGSMHASTRLSPSPKRNTSPSSNQKSPQKPNKSVVSSPVIFRSPMQQVCSMAARTARAAERERRRFAVSTEFDMLRRELENDLKARKVHLAEELNADAFNARSLGDLEKIHAFQRVRLARDQRFQALDKRAVLKANWKAKGGGIYSKNKKSHRWLLDFDDNILKEAREKQTQHIISQTENLDRLLDATRVKVKNNLSSTFRKVIGSKILSPLSASEADHENMQKQEKFYTHAMQPSPSNYF